MTTEWKDRLYTPTRQARLYFSWQPWYLWGDEPCPNDPDLMSWPYLHFLNYPRRWIPTDW
jgi:hypothetical protein